MSRVVATETARGRAVVVKVFPPELAYVVSSERFRREPPGGAAAVPGDLLPPQSGDADGLLHYTMPFVEGESLRQRLARPSSIRSAVTQPRGEPLRGWIVRPDWDEWMRITGLLTNQVRTPAL